MVDPQQHKPRGLPRIRRFAVGVAFILSGIVLPFELRFEGLRPSGPEAGRVGMSITGRPAMAAEPGEDDIESEIEDAIEDRVEDAVESRVEDAIEQKVEDELEDRIEDKVEEKVEDAVEHKVEDAVEDGLENGLADRAEDALADRRGDDSPRGRGGDDGRDRGDRDAARHARDGRKDDARDAAAGARRVSADEWQDTRTVTDYAAVLDDAGDPVIEDDVLVLLEPAEAASLADRGLAIAGRTDLAALGLVLARIRRPPGQRVDEAAQTLADRFGGDRVDLNHLYELDSGAGGTPPATTGWTVAAAAPVLGLAGRIHGPARIGMIDSGVDPDHPCLAGLDIVEKRFLAYAAPAPPVHGTAVASILAAAPACGLDGLLEEVALYDAAVFFRTPQGRVSATAESLIAALDWLVRTGATVVNISLSGPPNRLLARAVSRAAAKGLVLVAAVGNAGPAAPPRYPAAYAETIAVTAVDRRLAPYVRAGRGPHVDFAAPGVDILVAAPGGRAVRSGTSMAAPFVAALLAGSLGPAPAPMDVRHLVTRVARTARDLGAPGFDPVFGHGLIRFGNEDAEGSRRADR